jgi:hypothetical protein
MVAFHGTQWSGWPAVTTFLGWAQVTKGIVHLCFPAHSPRSMAPVPPERAWKLAVAGALTLPLAGVMLATSQR